MESITAKTKDPLKKVLSWIQIYRDAAPFPDPPTISPIPPRKDREMIQKTKSDRLTGGIGEAWGESQRMDAAPQEAKGRVFKGWTVETTEQV